jgi:hypothetical protein
MTDIFSDYSSGLESPATHLAAIVPSDTDDLAVASRGINVSTSGAVRMSTVGGTTETVFIAAGAAFPIRATRIWATGTSATGIVALY